MAGETELANLIVARAALIASIASGESPVLEIEIRGKRVKYESTTAMLDALNRAIKTLTAEVDATSATLAPMRNRARTNR